MRRSHVGMAYRAGIGLVLLLWASNAGAFCIKKCDGTKVRWPGNQTTFQLGKKSFASPEFLGAIQAARDAWNQSPAFFTVHMSYPTNSVGLHNGVNKIWFTTDQSLLEGAAGTTLRWYGDCGEIEETDIAFDANPTVPWTPGTVKASDAHYGGNSALFRTAAIHEIGHALGLCHNRWSYNIMGDQSTVVNANGSTLRPYAGASGIAGELYLYDVWPPSQYEDVSVVHWKYGGVNGEYSFHVRTEIFDTSDNPLPTAACSASNPVACFVVFTGQTVKLEFTYENLGRHTQDVDIGYYLSTNSLITTSDTLLGVGNIPALGRPIVTTNNTFVTIPTDLTPGQVYYIGAIVNYNKKFSEATGANNATFIGIRVK